ncbi:PAS domain S-box-containing protein [Neobacillus niacini]|uniref:PAS domain-containing protein n=1 Tax=Neobacillus niacini TaxID=86668 RepID=UPI0027898F28|nr:PAS domain-containing protein [Neobacillus niacini]MDQ1003402.1 PAS domain S-box-containing protein [Neobacillus niacini]
MIVKYKGRIISLIVVICAIAIWNTIYYGIYNYQYNFLLDTCYTIVVAGTFWWLSSYYDRSRILLKNLSESEEKFKILSDSTNYVFNNLNQAVFQVDPHGNLTRLNHAWETLTGFKLQESLGENLFSFIYHDDRCLANKEAHKYIENRATSIQEEVRIKKKDGGFIWLELNTKINYNSFGILESAVGTLTDITH